MSEIGKGASGLVGFPTPNTAADVEAYLLFLFPDPDWAQYVLGAAKNLTVPYNWYEAGDMLPSDAAEAFRLIVEQAPYNIRNNEIDAPFWDEESGDDTDDLATRDDQTWYGQWDGETFIESLAYVFLTNFLSKLITTQGAIKYLAIPRTFRLLIKQNPHGAKLLLFLDGGLYAVVNGYSIVDQVLEVIVKAVAPSMGFRAEDVEPLELMIVHSGEHDPDATPDDDGNYTVDVIRGRLSEEDVIPPNIRYNPETDTVQFSPDGGETWNDAEGQDPRRAPAFLKPPLTGSDARCNAAASMVAWVKAFMDEIIADLEFVGTAGLIVSTALNAWSLLVEPIAIIDLIADVAATIGGFGSSLLDTAFSSETYDLLLCIFFCDISANGQVTEEQFVKIQTDISSLNATAEIVMALILGAQGRIGLSNAGTIYPVTGDCDECTDCDRCYTWYFDDGDGDWTPRSVGEGSYTGAAWVATYYAPDAGKLVVIEHDIPAGVTIKSLSPNFSYVLGSTGGCPAGETRGAFLRYLNSSGDYINSTNSELPLPTGDYPNTVKLTAENTPVKVQINIWSAECDHTDGAVTIHSATITGRWADGDFPPDNC